MAVKRWSVVLVVCLASLLMAVLIPVVAYEEQPAKSQGIQPGPNQRQEPTPEARQSWVKLPPMPVTATQADYGAELFRLVCRDCHGDKGQGLTDEWRATWAAEDQNCWQSKCHALNHPPDGFEIPHYIRPIIGPGALPHFETAADLFAYNQVASPWYNPGSMTDEEYWQVTAFLVRENGVDPIEEPLDGARAAELRLHPEGRPAMAGQVWPEAQRPIWPWLALLAVPGAAILLLVFRRLMR